MNEPDTKRGMAAMKCNLCKTAWSGESIYCPSCGSPVLRKPRSFRFLEIAVAAVVVLVVVSAAIYAALR